MADVHGHDAQPKILLERMRQQEEVRTAEDDWTGSTNAAERRKRQNRIHQRLYRKRQREKKLELGKGSQTSSSTTTPVTNASSSPTSLEVSISDIHGTIVASIQAGCQFTEALRGHLHQFHRSPWHVDHLVQNLENVVADMYRSGSPRSDMLLTLIQFNVFRALVQNTFVSGFGFNWLEGEAISHFNTTSRFWTCPPALQPTKLQCIVEHHPWIDILPFPELRDNILLQGEDYDDSPLCWDLVELCHVPSGRNGLIVWGEAWDPAGWEVTEKFAQKWSWLLRGCEGLLRSTNKWRRERGEEEIYFDVRPVEELE